MTDDEFLGYVDLHSRTERALFLRKHVPRRTGDVKKQSSWIITGWKWKCPQCGGDNFGSVFTTYHCHGNSQGAPACGYTTNEQQPKLTGA